VSTVPLAYGTPALREEERQGIVRHFVELCSQLIRIEAEEGVLLHLGLEPEPDCALERTPQTLSWFREELFRRGAPLLAAREGKPVTEAEALLRRHLGVCVDSCHAAMQFEDPAEGLAECRRAGVRVSKIQLSAALECIADADALAALRAFDDGVYLHQVKSADGQSWPDLPSLFRDPPAGNPRIRIHCHVPLHWRGAAPLQSTRDSLSPAFWDAVTRGECRHVEVETYTFSVLPEFLRGAPLADNVAAECAWARTQLERSLSWTNG
jgi:hypothetical protein